MQAFLELGELLLPTDSNAALEALKTVHFFLWLFFSYLFS